MSGQQKFCLPHLLLAVASTIRPPAHIRVSYWPLTLGTLLLAAAAYLFYHRHHKAEALDSRRSYQREAHQYENQSGVAVAHHTGERYAKPFNDATAWTQEQQSRQALLSELAATR
jgi:hypothetical protein